MNTPHRFANWQQLNQLATRHRPKSYLEIGVCAGHSLGAVLDACAPDRLVLCDLWSPEYRGSSFVNHNHITKLLADRNFTGHAEFVDGDSRVTVPQLAGTFDLIHIDGDHSEEACTTDMVNCWPLLAPGGHMVVDDLIHAPSVLVAVNKFMLTHPNALSVMELEIPDGCAVFTK